MCKVLAFALVLVAGCNAAGTYIWVSIEAGPGVVARALDLRAEIPERGTSVARPLPNEGGQVALPGYVVLELPDVSMDVIVTLSGSDPSGASLSASRTVHSQRGERVDLVLRLEGSAPPPDLSANDLSNADLSGADLSTPPDLISPPDLTSVPIVFRSAAGSDLSGGDTHVLTRPTPVMQDDLLIASLAIGYSGDPNPTITPPAGWVLIRRIERPDSLAFVFYGHFATNNEPASYTFTNNGRPHGVGTIVAYSGVSKTMPVVIDQGQLIDNSASQYSTPSISPNVANTMLVATFTGYADAGAGTWSIPPGMTARVLKDDGRNRSTRVFEMLTSATGPTGMFTSTANPSQDWAATHLLALRPAQ
jgi:hypothetical protein